MGICSSACNLDIDFQQRLNTVAESPGQVPALHRCLGAAMNSSCFFRKAFPQPLQFLDQVS